MPYLVARQGASIAVGIAAFLITGIVWSIVPEARSGRTVGKLLLGIRLWDHRAAGPPRDAQLDGATPIGVGRAGLRWAVKYLVGGILPVGYLWYFRDPSGRAWHDLAAGTAVVSVVSDRGRG